MRADKHVACVLPAGLHNQRKGVSSLHPTSPMHSLRLLSFGACGRTDATPLATAWIYRCHVPHVSSFCACCSNARNSPVPLMEKQVAEPPRFQTHPKVAVVRQVKALVQSCLQNGLVLGHVQGHRLPLVCHSNLGVPSTWAIVGAVGKSEQLTARIHLTRAGLYVQLCSSALTNSMTVHYHMPSVSTASKQAAESAYDLLRHSGACCAIAA
jgi:hypothetical protein